MREKQEMLLIECKKLHKELEDAKLDKATAINNLKIHQSKCDLKDSTKSRLDDYEIIIAKYKAENSKIENMLSDIKAKNTTIDNLKKEASMASIKRNELEEQLQEAKAQQFNEGIAMHKLKCDYEEALRLVKHHQEKEAMLQASIDTIKEENNNNRLQRDTLDNQNALMHSKLSKLELEFISTKSKLSQFESKLKITEKAYKDLQEDYNRAIRKRDFSETPEKYNYKPSYASLNNTMIATVQPEVNKKTPDHEKKYNDTKYKQNISTVGDIIKWGENAEMKNRSGNKEDVSALEPKLLELVNQKKTLEAEYSRFSAKVNSIQQRRRKEELEFEIDIADKNISRLRQKLKFLAT